MDHGHGLCIWAKAMRTDEDEESKENTKSACKMTTELWWRVTECSRTINHVNTGHTSHRDISGWWRQRRLRNAAALLRIDTANVREGLIPFTCFVSSILRPRHTPWLDYLNIRWRVKLWRPSLRNFLRPPFSLSLLGPNILLSTSFSITICILSKGWETKVHTGIK
jgi:hypothetical protein